MKTIVLKNMILKIRKIKTIRALIYCSNSII